MRPLNSKNKSFYHYFIQDYNDVNNSLGDKQYFFTTNDITNKYNISRQTIYRILNNNQNSRFNHYIEKVHIHKSIIEHI